MCEVMMPDGVTLHVSNRRATILDDPGAWFRLRTGMLYSSNSVGTLSFPTAGFARQGPQYTGAGFSNVGSVAREIVEKHLDVVLVRLA